jgi:Flp pilus assembly protein TadD
MPVVPGLVVFAAFGLVTFFNEIAGGKIRFAVSYAALLVISIVFISWPQRDPSLWALDAYNSGWQALESDNLSLAEQKLSLAYDYVPDNAETNFALGNLRLAQGDKTGAKSLYRTTLRLDPKHTGRWNNLGVLALDEQRWTLAIQFLQNAPDVAKTHYLRALAFRGSGDIVRARREIETALRLRPDQPEFVEFYKTMQQ